MIKNETDDIEDNELYVKTEKDDEIIPKEEQEGGSEDETEEGFDEEKTEEDDDEGNEDSALTEPQDLSLVDYSRYDNNTLTDAHTAATAEETFVFGAAASRVQPIGKLSCDICGLSCVSINVLQVHKRSHTGMHRNTTDTPDLKHKSCAISRHWQTMPCIEQVNMLTEYLIQENMTQLDLYNKLT